jgi:hypothetical protein
MNRVILCLLLLYPFFDDKDEKKRPIVLTPVKGTMNCNIRVEDLDQTFVVNIPESIGSAENPLLLNFPDVKPSEIDWKEDKDSGGVWYTYEKKAKMKYTVLLTPYKDFVELEMTIENLSSSKWHDLFAFNCFNPVAAREFKDPELRHTFISIEGKARVLADIEKTVNENRPGVSFYLKKGIEKCPFADGFSAVSPEKTDSSWIAAFTERENYYMAVVNPDSVFLFSNTEFGCIHSAPNFGDLNPGESSRIRSRLYVAKGNLAEFVKRAKADIQQLRKKKNQKK